MPPVRFTNALADEYASLYNDCEIKPDKFSKVDAIVDGVIADKARYEAVAGQLDIPWYFIAAIHNLESSRRFTRHLHNGDSLSARTRHVPAGRPAQGTPPFSWEESAQDALQLRDLHKNNDWSLPRLLYELEGYNGWGYRQYHSHVLSPYLWGYSNHYDQGKYVADGRWSDTAVSNQCGGAVLIRRLEERGLISIGKPAGQKVPFFQHSDKQQPRADDLQRFLNTFADTHLRVDGKPGNKTSDAVARIFGHRLHKDPRDA